jgi:hypothetical protein
VCLTFLAGIHIVFLLVINVYLLSKNCLERVHSLFIDGSGSYSSYGVTRFRTKNKAFFGRICWTYHCIQAYDSFVAMRHCCNPLPFPFSRIEKHQLNCRLSGTYPDQGSLAWHYHINPRVFLHAFGLLRHFFGTVQEIRRSTECRRKLGYISVSRHSGTQNHHRLELRITFSRRIPRYW